MYSGWTRTPAWTSGRSGSSPTASSWATLALSVLVMRIPVMRILYDDSLRSVYSSSSSS